MPNFKNKDKVMIPLRNSTKKYTKDIFSLQKEHFALRNKYEKSGIL